MPWDMFKADVAGGMVYSVPLGPEPYRRGRSVLGWIERLSDGFRRYDTDNPGPVKSDAEEAILDLIEHRAYEDALD